MHDEGKAMTMVDHNESVLGDNPTDEDKLGFTEPAARLADKIARFPADTPMVVGVEGKWGEGKSSFLLIMKKHWREQACLAQGLRTRKSYGLEPKHPDTFFIRPCGGLALHAQAHLAVFSHRDRSHQIQHHLFQ